MPLLTVSNVQHAYGTMTVLDGATFSIEPGEKIGLVGRNGSGKSTLLKAIRGVLVPDHGSVQFSKGSRIGYLSQHPELDPEDTLRGAAEGAFATLHTLHKQLEEVYEQMATAEGDELEKLMRTQARLEGGVEAEGGYAIDHRIDATLHGLGFTDDQFSLQVKHLSGGQKGRLGLARLLLEAPDLLLLDEPTNHLDIAGRTWLENYLADEYTGAVIVVSHDRWLLDRVVSRIIEVHMGQIRTYPGNYHKFVELRLERQMTQARQHGKQMDKIRQEEAFIRKYKTGQRAKQARGRESRLQRYKESELIDRPMELNVMRLNLPKAPQSGEMVLQGEGVSKSYDDLTLFDDIDLTLMRGDRIGIIGPNGTGKTTLVKCLLEELAPDAGSVRLGSRVSVGYYRQLQEDLDLSLEVWQYLQKVIGAGAGDQIVPASEQQARDLAGAFLFSGQDQEKLLGEMSGGERSRAVLAGLVAGAHNLLVLDEPTNHLDIPSAERLEQALSVEGGYTGAVILISHDRALLDSTCERLVIFDGDGNVTLFQGTYSDWVAKQKSRTDQARKDAEEAEKAKRDAARKKKQQEEEKQRKQAAASKGGKGKGKGKRSGGAKQSGPRGLSVSKLESRIEELESRLREIDTEMLNPEVYQDGERCKALQAERSAVALELTPLEEEWMRRAN